MKGVEGKPHWLSPEIVQLKYHSKEADIWAFGCFAYELATGAPPFANVENDLEIKI